MTIGLVILAIASLLGAARDLHRRGSEDVLRAVLFAETGALFGAMLGLFVPGGFFLGLLGGVVLAARRFGEIGRERRRELEARVASAETRAEALLALHDRADDLLGPPGGPTRRVATALGVAAMGAAALGLVGVGVGSGSFPATVLGIAISFWPVATLADTSVRHDEREVAQRLLMRAEDPERPAQLEGDEEPA